MFCSERGAVRGEQLGEGVRLAVPVADQPGPLEIARPAVSDLEVESEEELRAAVRRAAVAGFQPCIHAIGDAAVTRALDIYERGVRDVATRNLDVVRQAYGLGHGSLLDVIGEQRRYIEVENGYTDVLKQVYDATVEIARATGGTSGVGR